MAQRPPQPSETAPPLSHRHVGSAKRELFEGVEPRPDRPVVHDGAPPPDLPVSDHQRLKYAAAGFGIVVFAAASIVAVLTIAL